MPLVVFECAGDKLYLDAEQVRSLFSAGSVTPLPIAPAAVVGLTQVEGEILCVLDPAAKPRALIKPNEPLLLVEHGQVRALLIVDRVLGIYDQPPSASDRFELAQFYEHVRTQAVGS